MPNTNISYFGFIYMLGVQLSEWSRHFVTEDHGSFVYIKGVNMFTGQKILNDFIW